MIVVIPMAGLGSRFNGDAYSKQKALIQVGGITLLEYSIRSLPLKLASQVLFVIRRNQLERELVDLITKLCSNFSHQIVILDSITRGQSETVYLGLVNQDVDESLLIHNCDTALNVKWDFETSFDGLFFSFYSKSDSYSYARLDIRGQVVELAEKVVISDFASSGTYWFKSVELYSRFFEHQIDVDTNSELYVVPIMQRMVNAGYPIGLVQCENVIPLGTPNDLANSQNLIKDWRPIW